MVSRSYFLRANDLSHKTDTYGSEIRLRAAAVPVAVVTAAGCWEAWHDSGSIAAAAAHGFLPYAVLAALLLAAVAASGLSAAPRPPVLVALGLLGGSACWAAISLRWSPVPSLARDEALLTAFYLVAIALPTIGLTLPTARTAALGLLTTALGIFTLAVAIRIGFSPHADSLFRFGRLYFPITYANAQGALFALGTWPALFFASRRSGAVLSRAVALAAASGFVAAATLAQSKGTFLGLAVSVLVVICSAPSRLRLLAPLGVVAAVEALAFRPLTGPYREPTLAAVHTAGRAVLLASLGGLLAGAVIALFDRRIEVSPALHRRIGLAVAGLAAAAVVAGAATFLVSERHPVGFAHREWTTFKHFDPNAGGSSHLTALGSNRYDFWRVALIEWKNHPIAGCGARCFGPEYLIRGRSSETPARAHSLPLELLAEQGIVGFALLGGALALVLVLLVAAARRSAMTATAALGGFVAWLVQCCVDWTWTIPALTAPALALAGIGLAAHGRGGLEVRVPRAAAVAAVLIALVVFAPPWVAQHLTDEALHGEASDPASALRWARRLDPISTAPLVAQAELTRSATEQIRLFREAARREPRVLETVYSYGWVLLNTGHRALARKVLSQALALDPGNPAVVRVLRLAEH